MPAVAPHLVHLHPPASTGRVSLERFSPMYTQPTRFPLRYRKPEASHRYVYPDTVDIDQVAYFFDYELTDTLPPMAYSGLRTAVAEWSIAWESENRPMLVYQSSPGFLRIVDGRHGGRDGTYTFHNLLAAIYLDCSDRPRTAEAVHRRLELDCPVGTVYEAFKQFQERGLMFLDGDLALSLAIPAMPGR